MSSRFFVGNVGPGASEHSLRDFFIARGLRVVHVSLVVDRATGSSRGFAFVEFEGVTEADAAIEALDGATLDSRVLVLRHVDERPPTEASPARRR